MNAQERLYAAIGGADPYFIVRSEKRRKSRWPGYCLAAAACLALLVTLGRSLPERADRNAKDPLETQTPSGFQPPAAQDPDLSQPPVSGTPRLLSYAPQSQEATDFLIRVNEESFSISEENGLYSVKSLHPLPEGFPECGLDIAHIPGTSCAEAKEAAQKALAERYAGLSPDEGGNAALPDSLYLRAGNGTDWDAEQIELWFVDDGQGGCFVLTARYFLEAEEGLGAAFRDMASSFRVISLSETIPDWMRELRAAAEELYPALFSNELSGVSGLLAKGAEAEAYGEDVWEDITVVSVDCAPDGGQEPSSATVSVKHRLNRVEGDSFNYLTMELSREGGRWLLTWAGLEK